MCFLMTTSNCSFASLLLSLEKTWVSLLQPYFWFPGQGFLPQKVYFHFLGLNLSLCMFFVPFSVCKEKPMWNITGDITLCMQWNITVWSQCIDIWIPKIFLMMVSVLVWYKWFHDSKGRVFRACGCQQHDSTWPPWPTQCGSSVPGTCEFGKDVDVFGDFVPDRYPDACLGTISHCYPFPPNIFFFVGDHLGCFCFLPWPQVVFKSQILWMPCTKKIKQRFETLVEGLLSKDYIFRWMFLHGNFHKPKHKRSDTKNIQSYIWCQRCVWFFQFPWGHAWFKSACSSCQSAQQDHLHNLWLRSRSRLLS